MRRPPEVGQAGLLVILLLGASGCAGFPQRTIGSSPWSAPADGQAASPPGLFSWWHREQLANHRGKRPLRQRKPETARPRPALRRSRTSRRRVPGPKRNRSGWLATSPDSTGIWNGSRRDRGASSVADDCRRAARRTVARSRRHL